MVMGKAKMRIVVLAACAATAAALEVTFTLDSKSYSVSHGGKEVFTADGGVAVFCDGKWHSQREGTLKMVGTPAPVTGSQPGLGAYTGTKLSWMAGTTPVTTTGRNFPDTGSVTFEYQFAKGAQGTSLVELANKTRDEVIVNFPAFTKQTLEGVLSWQGSFVGAVEGKVSKGPQGGPTVFFDPSDSKLSTVIVGSAADNFKSTSAGPGTTYDGVTSAWAPGTPGTIKSLPAGYTQTILLHAGSGAGITAAISEWGGLLQAMHKSYKIPDVTLQKIGYQTDNGAYYVFCRDRNCSKTLLDVCDDLKALGKLTPDQLNCGWLNSTMMSIPTNVTGERGAQVSRWAISPSKEEVLPRCLAARSWPSPRHRMGVALPHGA